MKFFCEYCGNRIDANVDRKCPNCGASYKKNKSFIKLEEEKKKENELNKEYKDKIFNHAIKFSKWVLIIPIVIFLVIITITIIMFSNIFNRAKSTSDEFKSNANSMIESIFDSDIIQDQISGNDEPEEKEVTVGINEYGSTKEYKAKVTKYEVVEDTFNRLEEGYEYVKFHLIVENISDEELTKEDVNCIVDGIAQTNKLSSGYSDLPMFIQKGLAVKGTATFEVPKDATSYDIRYGEYITIHIEK